MVRMLVSNEISPADGMQLRLSGTMNQTDRCVRPSKGVVLHDRLSSSSGVVLDKDERDDRYGNDAR